MRRWRNYVITFGIGVLLFATTGLSFASGWNGSGSGSTRSRSFKVTYNAALSMHQAAVPVKFAKPGKWMRVTFHGKSVKVRAVTGGCRCFDISDEAFNKLSDTSRGVIRAKVTKL